MEYTVLARRFRPQSFGEVVGQEHISQALRNAISAGRVAHAYLFTGARGVGKTSTARILAKSLNCPQAKAGDPCNECEICRSISVGSDVDVLEIDGASNRGIDEIRSLRANVNVKPMRCRHKIYIIDEVHMLTKEAFNALLKTLEEPPPNVKFIFCTTEPQKVPDTILSRCQRFDFGTIATATINQRLTEIAAVEGVVVEPAAVELVARRAAGSMRDSQSLFDQLLAFGGKSVNVADVHRLLGTAPDERLIELGAALVTRDRARTLDLLQEALDGGAQLSELTDQLMGYFRDLMVLSAGAASANLVSVSGDRRDELAGQARQWGLASIMAGLQILSETKARMKGVTYSRVLAELALVRIASLEDLERLAGAIDYFKSGKMPPAGAGGGIAAPPRSMAPLVPAGDGGARRIPAAGNTGQAAPQSAGIQKKNELTGEAEGGLPPASLAEEGVEPAVTIPFEIGNESTIWTEVVSRLTDMMKSHAKNVASVAISGPNQLVLTFPKSYHLSKQYFERTAEPLRRLEEVLQGVVDRSVRIQLTLSQTEAPVPSPAADAHPTRAETERRHQEAEKDPLVQQALLAFGGTLVRVDTVSSSSTE